MASFGSNLKLVLLLKAFIALPEFCRSNKAKHINCVFVFWRQQMFDAYNNTLKLHDIEQIQAGINPNYELYLNLRA